MNMYSKANAKGSDAEYWEYVLGDDKEPTTFTEDLGKTETHKSLVRDSILAVLGKLDRVEKLLRSAVD